MQGRTEPEERFSRRHRLIAFHDSGRRAYIPCRAIGMAATHEGMMKNGGIMMNGGKMKKRGAKGHADR